MSARVRSVVDPSAGFIATAPLMLKEASAAQHVTKSQGLNGAEQVVSQRHMEGHCNVRRRCTKAGGGSGHKRRRRALKASTCEPSQDIARVLCVKVQVARNQVYSEHVKALGVPFVECHHDLQSAGGMLECAAGP